MLIADMKNIGDVHSGAISISEIYYGQQLVWKKGAGFTSIYDREVEYLLAKDTDTYIITDIKLQDLSHYTIETKCWCGLGATMIFGVRDVAVSSGNVNAFALIHSANGSYQLRVQTGSSVGILSANNTDPYIFRWVGKESRLYTNDKVTTNVIASQAQSVDSNYGLALFGCNSGGFVDNMGKERCIYYFKVWYDDELVADYIPVIDNNGIACFYDTVTEKLIRCSGIGKFDFAEKEQVE